MEKRITAIVVDDEENSRFVLCNLLEEFFPEVEVAGQAADVDEAYSLVIGIKPQLVFLDIQMPRASGFALLQKFDMVPFEVIFVTSFDRYAINAIKFSALDYLLKPVEVSALKGAIDKAIRCVELKTSKAVQVINLLKNMGDVASDKKIAVHSGDSVKFIGANSIAYIEADGSYCNITTHANEHYATAKVLKDFEDYFGDTSDFVRIHKSCLLNIKHIKQYSKGEPCIIEMVNGKTFEVARRKKQEVLEKLKK